jgi:hypothetical protein
VVNAARVAKVFQMNPLDILRETDMLAVQVLFAAAKVVNDDERKSAEANKAKSGTRRPRRR